MLLVSTTAKRCSACGTRSLSCLYCTAVTCGGGGAALQVTNPPIDPLREGLVMSLEMRLGGRGNLLAPGPDTYRQGCWREALLLLLWS
jgi:hypothetical protein